MACSIASQPVCSLIWSKTLPATELPVKGRSHLGQPFLKYWRCPILKSFFSWRAKGPKEFSGNSTLPPGKATERKAGGRVRKRFLTLFMNTSSRCQKGETLNSIFPRPIRLVGAELLGRCQRKFITKQRESPKHKCLKIWPGYFWAQRGESTWGKRPLKLPSNFFFYFASPLCRANSCYIPAWNKSSGLNDKSGIVMEITIDL